MNDEPGPAAPDGYRYHADVRVRFAETDAQGVVYHSNFLIYCEVARVEFGRKLHEGRPGPGQRGYDFVLAHAECDYRAAARFDDRLRVWLRCAAVGTSSITYQYRIVRWDGTLVCDAKTVQVAVDPETRRPVPLPQAIVDRLTTSQTDPKAAP
jgi:acyl-CoA thioester hydrolase